MMSVNEYWINYFHGISLLGIKLSREERWFRNLYCGCGQSLFPQMKNYFSPLYTIFYSISQCRGTLIAHHCHTKQGIEEMGRLDIT